jgi:hypothetical protein
LKKLRGGGGERVFFFYLERKREGRWGLTTAAQTGFFGMASTVAQKVKM